MHREFLKNYSIDTIEDALQRSNSLFKMACELVRLIDIDSINEKQISSKNRRLADTLPVWDYISDSYNNSDFMQVATPLERVEKITYRYSLEDAKKSIKRTIKRLMLHQNTPTLFYLQKILRDVKDEFILQKNIKDAHDEFVDSQIQGNKTDEYKSYSNPGLLEFEESLILAMRSEEYGSHDYNEISSIYNEVHNELVERGLKEPLPF